jgi:hypothetical protein
MTQFVSPAPLRPAKRLRNDRWERAVVPYISRVRNDRAKYRRRRLGALFVVAALAFALYAGRGAGAESETVSYTVAPGRDALGDRRGEHPAGEDPRPKVEAIREANDLSGSRSTPA